MKTRKLLPLLVLLALLPAASQAEGLTELFDTVQESLSEGLEAGAAMAYAGMAQDLTLSLETQSAGMEAGKPLRLTITAGNPRPQETDVEISLKLPERLSAAPDAVWKATLPAAQVDEQSGAYVPSVTTFTRELTLAPGGEGETVMLEAEMAMGSRFYRAQAPLELCVADVQITAKASGTQAGRLQPGDAFSYEVDVVNRGTAPKDMTLELALPEGAVIDGALPSGFEQEEGVLRGVVRAEAAAKLPGSASPSRQVIRIPLRVEENALDGDEDALRLLSGALLCDGERVALPRVQVCSAKISAQLIADTDSLKAGEATMLRMVIVNSGLAPADVHLSCVLPQGLRLVQKENDEAKESAKTRGKERTEKKESAKNNGKDEAQGTAEEPEREMDDRARAVTDRMDGPGGAQGDMQTEDKNDAVQAVLSREKRTLAFDLSMDAARETDAGVSASTRVIELSVVADAAMDKIQEQLVSAALAWTVDEGDMQLGDAVAMRVYRPAFLGMTHEDCKGLFWACALLVATIGLLAAAVRTDRKQEDYCCE